MIINLYPFAIGMDDPFTQHLSHVNNNDQDCVDLLPPDFEPGKWDVICQRGKECFDHVGNRRFRMCIDSHLDQYMKVKSRQQKSKIVTNIVQNIRSAAAQSGGGFVRKDLLTRRWFKVGDKLAREKVGQALRDAIKTRRASGSKPSPNELDDTVPTVGQKRTGEEASLVSKLDNNKDDEDFDDDITKPAKKACLSSSITTSFNLPQTSVGLGGLHQQFPDEGSSFSVGHGHRSALQAALQASTMDDLFGGQLQLSQQQQQQQKKPKSNLRFDNQLEAELEPTPIQNQTRMLPDLINQSVMASNTFNLNQYSTSISNQQQLLRLQHDLENLQGGALGGYRGSMNALFQADSGLIPSWNPTTSNNTATSSSYEQQMLQTVIQSRRLSLSLSGDHTNNNTLDAFQAGGHVNRSSVFANQFKLTESQEIGQATLALANNIDTTQAPAASDNNNTTPDWEDFGSQIFKF